MTTPNHLSSGPDASRRAATVRTAATSCESTLLARLRAGDEGAFETWVRAETPRMLGSARRILRNEEDAREAVQESFLQAFRALGDFAGQARLSTWLHRITINAALMQLRRRRRHPEQSIEELLPRFTEDGHRVDPGPRWPALPDDAVDRGELRRVLQECYDRLPEPQRLVLLLRDVEGLDTDEAAAVLGVGRNAVKMRLHRARQALRTLLEPYVLEGLRPAAIRRQGAAGRRGRPIPRRTSRTAAPMSSGAVSGTGPSGATARASSSAPFRYPSG